MRCALLLSVLIPLGACATPDVQIPQGSAALGDPAKPVAAVAETIVTTDPTVDADDPVLWADAKDPSRALWIGTDKTDGLYVHNLDGTMRQFFPDGPLNNVDLRDGFVVDGKSYVLIAAAERARFGIVTYLLDPATLKVASYGFIPTDMGEPYGFCMGKRGDAIYLMPNNKNGEARQYRVTAGPKGPIATLERTMKVATQTEGCVVDDEAQVFYLGEEDRGIWRFDFDPKTPSTPTLVYGVDKKVLTDDVEGLTIMRDGPHKYLIASSQGDSTYPVWLIEGATYTYKGRFAVEGGAIDNVTVTDGIDAWSGPIGPYPNGAISMHDTDDGDGKQQNYKLVDWRDVKKALALP
ncbi:3-phytase [Alphaproteobacteria bacterium SO-S41]|nr:3-phytase [Alphaproteobacteria bacterium SO-S41]